MHTKHNATHYANEADFCGLFEADTFDVEVITDSGYLFFVRNDDDELVFAAEFVFDSAQRIDGSGYGWYDDSVV